MKISEVSIRNPVFAWMIMGALLLFGGLGYYKMGVSQYPDVDFPSVSIRLSYPGAAPEVMEKDVIDPIEAAIVSVAGIENISSTARNGSGSVSAEFNLSVNIDVAVQEVQSAIARAQRQLPEDLEPPIVTKSNVEDQPIMWLSVRSETLSKDELMFMVRRQIRDQFTTVQGVSEIFLGGYVDPALRVDLKSDALVRYQLTVNDIVNAIQSEHREDPAGRIESPTEERPIRVMGEATSVDEFKNVMIKKRGGGVNYNPIPISQVANVYEGLEDVRRLSRVQGEASVGLGIRKQRGANAVDVGRAVKERMDQIKDQLPKGVTMAVNYDSTPFIEDTVSELVFTIFLAAILTSIVCWVFLGSFASTINVILAIPTSIVGTFLVMYFLGFTLNTFSLLGLSLAIGIVVDDAIIVLENIMRHRQMGKNRIKAALDGTKEISFAVIATTVALISIFLPVAFLDGIIGRFFFQFAVTLCVAVALSSFEALTLAPMRCSRMLDEGKHTTRVGLWIESVLTGVTNAYSRALPKVLNHRVLTLVVSVVLFGASLLIFPKLKKEFVPYQDSSSLFISLKTDTKSSLEFTDQKMREVEKLVMNEPAVLRYFTAIGGFSGGQSSQAMMFITLKTPGDRPVYSELGHRPSQLEVVQALRKKLGEVKGIRAFIPTGGGGVFGGRGRGYGVELSVRGPEWETLVDSTKKLEEAFTKDPRFVDVNMGDVEGVNEIHIVPNRQAAKNLGVEISGISQTIQYMVGGASAGLYSKGGQRFNVLVQLQEKDRRSLDQIKKILIRNNRGELVPISQVVRIETRNTAPSITREDRVRAVSINANPAEGIDQAKALEDAKVLAASVLPKGYYVVDAGSAETFKESFIGLLVAMILGILVSYMVLGSQFNSFRDPLIVLSALPFAFSGAFIGLLVFSQSFNVYSFIGVILLIGIVKKNSILLVDFSNQMRNEGMGINEALIEACPLRLRPILMTSFSTIAAAIPGALNFGPGAETRIPLSVVVVGGVFVSTFFTLFVVPCLYSLIASKTRHEDEFREALVS
ncbi:MAG: acriflavin resistance protein [Bdellovibrionaceae bacterium]|nr:acriflavin resistance protein [Pseudobdellovibrionaceae bacterium]